MPEPTPGRLLGISAQDTAVCLEDIQFRFLSPPFLAEASGPVSVGQKMKEVMSDESFHCVLLYRITSPG